MPSIALVAPYMRTSMLHIPRRDLVLSAADSLFLRLVVVESDTPCAQSLQATNGIGGPGARIMVWSDRPGWLNDYGMLLPTQGQVLYNEPGVPLQNTGSFDWALPSGTMVGWPPRCAWCVQLTYGLAGVDVLLSGRLHMRPLGVTFGLPLQPLLTSEAVPVQTDSEEQVYV